MRVDPLRIVIVIAITAALGVKGLFWLNHASGPSVEASRADAVSDAAAGEPADPKSRAILSGTVYDEHGNAAAGRSVRLLRTDPQVTTGGLRSRQRMQRTDNKGHYRFQNLEPGTYLVMAAMNVTASQRVFHPDASRVKAATPIAVTAGQERTGVDLRYRPAVTSTVEGRITRADGTPVRITVDLMAADAPEPDRVRLTTGTDQDGRFSFIGVPADEYRIVAHTQVRGTVSSDAPINGRPLVASAKLVLNGETPAHVTMIARPAMSVSARLTFHGSAATLPDAREQSTMIRLAGRDRWSRAMLAVVDTPTRTNGDGVVTIHGVPAGAYELITTTGPRWVLESARLGQGPWPMLALDVREGIDSGGIDLVLAAAPSGGPISARPR